MTLLQLGDEQGVQFEQLDAHVEPLRLWSEHAPMNYAHKLELVLAERARVLGDSAAALDHYEQAIAGAAQHGFLQDEALVNELYGRFWLERRNHKIARLYLSEAHALYGRWGAGAITAHLEALYPDWLATGSDDAVLPPSFNPNGKELYGSLDLRSVMDAAEAIAGEQGLTQLVSTMLSIIMTSAGAERVFLLSNEDDQWLIEAHVNAGSTAVQVGLRSAIADHDMIATAIVRYVARTRQVVLLDDAVSDGRFVHDPMIQRRQVRSLLVLPLVNRGNLIAVLYLENNLASHVFSQERVQLLELLSGQIAISIEQGRLHDHLEAEIAARTQALSFAEEQVSALFERSPIGISLTTISGRILTTNPALLEMVGFLEEEVIGRTVTDFYFDPGQRADMLEQMSASGMVNNFAAKIKRKSESWFHAAMNVSTVSRDGEPVLLAMIQGVTEIVQTEQALQTQIGLVDGLLDAATETIEIVDANTLEYIKWNSTFNQVTGYTDEEIVVMDPVADFFDPADLPQAEAAMSELLSNGHATAILRQVNKDGVRTPFEYTGAVAKDSNGDPKHMIIIGRDVTERRRAEEALHASRRFVQSSLDALSANIVILDADGVIVGLNGAWHRFAQNNRMAWADHGLDRNYLGVLDTVKGADAETARKAAAGIRSVITTELGYFEMEYACHSPDKERWFAMRVTRFEQENDVRVVVAHEDVSERKLGEARLAELAVHDERTRLARDLHDSVTQTLYGLDLFANTTQQALAAGKTDVVFDHAQQIRMLSQHALADMRRLLFELRPSALEEMGIAGALRRRLELVEARAGIETELQTNVVEPFPTAVETELYAIALEALNNSLKHGQAKQIYLALDCDGRHCSLVVQDDGVGFDIEVAKHGGGHGLRIMQERADQFDGLLSILSTPGNGVIIKVEATF